MSQELDTYACTTPDCKSGVLTPKTAWLPDLSWLCLTATDKARFNPENPPSKKFLQDHMKCLHHGFGTSEARDFNRAHNIRRMYTVENTMREMARQTEEHNKKVERQQRQRAEASPRENIQEKVLARGRQPRDRGFVLETFEKMAKPQEEKPGKQKRHHKHMPKLVRNPNAPKRFGDEGRRINAAKPSKKNQKQEEKEAKKKAKQRGR